MSLSVVVVLVRGPYVVSNGFVRIIFLRSCEHHRLGAVLCDRQVSDMQDVLTLLKKTSKSNSKFRCQSFLFDEALSKALRIKLMIVLIAAPTSDLHPTGKMQKLEFVKHQIELLRGRK